MPKLKILICFLAICKHIICSELHEYQTLNDNNNNLYHLKINNIHHLCVQYNETYMIYKTLYRTLSIIILLGLQHIAISQCSLENLSVTIIDCVNDNNAGLVINFQSDTPSTIGYQIATQLGFVVVQYNQLPYTLVVSGNCITDYNLTVKDLSIADCEKTQNVGVICCDVMCNIETEITGLECIDNESILTAVDFNITGTNADSVDIFTNDNYVSTIAVSNGSPFLLPKLGPVQDLVICTQGTECCDTLDIFSPCYCNIFDVHAAVTDCDSIMEAYFLRIDFETTSPSSDSFSIGRTNNLLGTFAYEDVPVRVGPISFDENDNDIFIVDQVDILCFGFIPHNTLDSCEAITCELTDLDVLSTIGCDNSGDVSFSIEFQTTLESEGFQILINENTFGPFQYGQQPYEIGPLALDSVSLSHVEIIDLEDNSCTIDTTVLPISCDCIYDNLTITQFCNEEILVAVLIDFNQSGAVNDSFDITSVINTQRFAYSELPITLNGLPNEDISLKITDAINSTCTLTVTADLECILECSITNFEVEFLSCEELGVADLSFTFDYNDFTMDTVTLSYNENILGNYIVVDSGEYTIPLLEIDCELDFNSFSLAPINDLDCAAEFPMPNIDCCTPCNLSNIQITNMCFDDMSVNLSVNFDYDGDSTDVFELYLFEELMGTYNYTQLPVDTSFTTLSPGEYPYYIDFTICQNEGTFSFDCDDECIVENITMDSIFCIDGEFFANIDFDHSEANDSFMVIVNEIIDGTYALNDLPLQLGPYEGDNTTGYIFTVNVLDEENCGDFYNLGIVNCAPNTIDEIIIDNISWTLQNNGVNVEGISYFEKMSLVDLNGRVIQQENIYSDQLLIEKGVHSTGLYFVRLQNQKGNVHTIKIIL